MCLGAAAATGAGAGSTAGAGAASAAGGDGFFSGDVGRVGGAKMEIYS